MKKLLFILTLIVLTKFVNAQIFTVPIQGGTVTLDQSLLMGKDGKDGLNGKDGVTTINYLSGITNRDGATYRCYSASDIDSAFKYYKLGLVNELEFKNTITKKIVVPIYKPLMPNPSAQLIFSGHGNSLIGSIKQEKDSTWKGSQSQSSNSISIDRLTIYVPAGDTGICLPYNLNLDFQRVNVRGGAIGIHFIYNMNYLVDHCFFIGQSYASVISDYAKNIVGTANPASDAPSNQGVIRNSRFFLSPNQFAGWILYAASNNKGENNTWEGEKHDSLSGCQYAIYNDYKGVTVDKLFSDEGSHNEYIFKKAFLYSRQAIDAQTFLSKHWQQKGGCLIEDVNGGKYYISFIPNWNGIYIKTTVDAQYKITDSKAFALDSINKPVLARIFTDGVFPAIFHMEYTTANNEYIYTRKYFIINGKLQ